MIRRIIAYAIVMSLASVIGAPAHDDAKSKVPMKKEEGHAGGHAATVGRPGDPDKVTTAIEVEMNDDMRFRPDFIEVKRGETVKFVVKNAGKTKHELVLGTIGELKAHAVLMRKFPEMEHDDPNQVSVEPGKTGELIWQFTQPGRFYFACLVPGHFEAGMVGKILVGRENGRQRS